MSENALVKVLSAIRAKIKTEERLLFCHGINLSSEENNSEGNRISECLSSVSSLIGYGVEFTVDSDERNWVDSVEFGLEYLG